MTDIKWAPTASLDNLKLRADFYRKIRTFFDSHHVLEVETPTLSQHTVTDLHIDSFKVTYSPNQENYYLQTSPEYAMKRLLASGSGPIYQITKAYRDGEYGNHHNPEFTMLEWYRPGFNHHDLIAEIDLFFQATMNTQPADHMSYRDLFITHLAIDPLTCHLKELHALLAVKQISVDIPSIDHDTALQLLLAHCIEPKLGLHQPIFIYDFPPSQAALAKIRPDEHPVAERFEAYIQGYEVANGFHELQNAEEQQKRFELDQLKRKKAGKNVPAIDDRLIHALKQGLPNCAGVAIGLDRLLMLLAKKNHIKEVISFDWSCA